MLTVQPVVEVSGIAKRFGDTVALDGVDLKVDEGELFALLGPNGAGKTTLVHILCTIRRPDAGIAVVAGYDVLKQPRKARHKIGVVFQEPSVDDRLTVVENLDFHGRIYGVPQRVRKERIDAMLALVGLSEWRNRLVRSLSGGMKRRLEIARSFVHDPSILFLDEPTVGLDAQTRAHMWEYIETLRRERRVTVLVTTHYIEEVERCSRVSILDRGKVLAVGTPAELKAAYGRSAVRVQLRDAESERAVLARYAGRATLRDGAVEVEVTDDDFVPRFMTEYGASVRGLTLVVPSLEGVFLTLTGSEIRDRGAGARERLYNFGARGGEFTR